MATNAWTFLVDVGKTDMNMSSWAAAEQKKTYDLRIIEFSSEAGADLRLGGACYCFLCMNICR